VLEIQIAALEHFAYCPRQCALMYIEKIYAENLYTTRGDLVHERVHDRSREIVDGVEVWRDVPVGSATYGLFGRCDMVELRPEGPYPVEYKSGRRHGLAADVQLCAQAVCLEEMSGQAVPNGAIYYHATRTRREIAITDDLRSEMIETVARVRELLSQDSLPEPPEEKRCQRCSLRELCLPDIIKHSGKLQAHQRTLYSIEEESDRE